MYFFPDVNFISDNEMRKYQNINFGVFSGGKWNDMCMKCLGRNLYLMQSMSLCFHTCIFHFKTHQISVSKKAFSTMFLKISTLGT